MDMTIDAAWHHQLPGRIDDFGRVCERIGQRHNLARANAYIGTKSIGRSDHRSAFYDSVEGHGILSSVTKWPGAYSRIGRHTGCVPEEPSR